MRVVTHPDETTHIKVDVCHRALARLNTEHTPSHIVLDKDDYEERCDLLNEFRDIAFSWHRGRPTTSTPQYLSKIMSDLTCSNLIWFSRKAIEYPEWLFIWILAHECRHVFQS